MFVETDNEAAAIGTQVAVEVAHDAGVDARVNLGAAWPEMVIVKQDVDEVRGARDIVRPAGNAALNVYDEIGRRL